MSALLTSADFTDLISPQLLINLTNDTPGATAADESVIDVCSGKAWSEMWDWLGQRYTKPATATAGSCKDILLTVTRYYLYSRRPELLATPEGEIVSREKENAIKRCKDAGAGDASIDGLTLLTADELEAAGAGAVYYANEVVYGPTTYRGF